MARPENKVERGPVPGRGSSYSAKDITVLEGLEPVRLRPGMYIGSTGPSGLHHLIWEVVDNSVDEAMAGACDRIDVTLLADGGVRVVDNGRGIPTDIHPKEKKSGVELALTKLHAGGKFGGDGYKVSGGLHGVGVSVVNALSVRLIVEIDQHGDRHRMEFHNGGKIKTKLEVVGKAPRGRTGTTISFWPDPSIFEDTEFSSRVTLEHLQIYAFLNAGLEIRFVDERPGHEQQQIYKYSGGIADYVKHLNEAKEPLFKRVCYFDGTESDSELEIALQWNTGFNEGIHCFANGIPNAEGGMHEEGFKKAITNVVNRYGKAKNLLKEKDDNLLGEDIREGLTAIVAVKLLNPQFEGQTKAKLGNVSIRSFVERVTNEKLASWLEEHPAEGRAIVQKALQAARARLAAREARNAIRRKSALEGAGMPDKLRDCYPTTPPEEAELYIVEGDSAGGSARDARDPRTMAILPIRGKILNVERARLDKMLKNAEIQALITAIGAGVGEEFDIAKARYHKVCIMSDADVDGRHICTLLLTLFFRQMRPLIDAGYVYITQPPLYSVALGKEKQYLRDDAALERFQSEHQGRNFKLTRLKGLGEMNAEELAETTMDPESRTLIQITLEQAALADEVFSVLMGEDVEARKNFIIMNAPDVRFLDV